MRFVQVDELWSFVAKRSGASGSKDIVGAGDEWLCAIDSDSKAVISYHVGKRMYNAARELMRDLRKRTSTSFN